MSQIVRTHILETVVPGKRLGRHIATDPRSANYPAEAAPGIISVRHQSSGLPLDQGDTGSCTGQALVGALNTVPHWKVGQKTLGERDALSAYSAEEVELGYGPFPPNDNGGTGLDVCKVGKARGWLSAYQHATDVTHALQALVLRPIMVGANWYTSFDHPAPSTSAIPGLVKIASSATVRGGHEFFADEIDAANELVWFCNSWGLQFAVRGRFCMTFNTLATLLQQGGDVTVPRTALGWHA